MDRASEVGICERVDAILERIRSKVFQMGMAGEWHIARASDIQRQPTLMQALVDTLDEEEKTSYLDCFNSLLAETKKQEARCKTYWDTNNGCSDITSYLGDREKLIELFLRFRFPPKWYEMLIRQEDKPLVQDAARLLTSGMDASADAQQIESKIRLTLRDLLALEEDLTKDLQNLDRARAELWMAHRDLARTIADADPRKDELTYESALVGLQRASKWYDYKRGYGFAEYAQHWIEEAIQKRRGDKCRN
jgi:DNA-directed RNA polymerase sigma subunit (sigma70/sigma32)